MAFQPAKLGVGAVASAWKSAWELRGVAPRPKDAADSIGFEIRLCHVHEIKEEVAVMSLIAGLVRGLPVNLDGDLLEERKWGYGNWGYENVSDFDN